MKKYQAKKILSVFLALIMAFSSFGLLSVVSFAAPTANPVPTTKTLTGDTVYTVAGTDPVTMTGYEVPEGKTVFIDIADGATLIIQGGNADGRTAGVAGIKMNTNSRLVITGEGTLVVNGGNGANGGNGGSSDAANNKTSKGGAGGVGGAGGGAGIGTNGGVGGNGNGGSGSEANSWPSNASVLIADTVSFNGGSNGGDGSTGGNGTQGNGNGAGGYGGGGGKGTGGAAIGTGGNGGTGGTNGTDGYTSGTCTTTYNIGTNGEKGADGDPSSSEDTTETTVFSDIQAVLDAYDALLAKTLPEMLEETLETLSSAYNVITDKWNPGVSAFSSGVIENYFASSVTPLHNLESAVTIKEYLPITDAILAHMAADVNAQTPLADLTALYSDFNDKYTAYKKINNQDVYNYFETGDSPIIVRASVEARLAEIENLYEIAKLTQVEKPLIETIVATYSAYDYSTVTDDDASATALNAAKLAVDSAITNLTTNYRAANVDLVFGTGYVSGTLKGLSDNLQYLLETHQTMMTFYNTYKNVYDQLFAPVSADTPLADLYALLSSKEAWYGQMQAFVEDWNASDPAAAEAIVNAMYATMDAKIQSVYDLLIAAVTAQIDTAYTLFDNYVKIHGYYINTASDISVNHYNELNAAFSEVNLDLFDFVENSDYTDGLTEETITKYNKIKDAVFAYVHFDESHGLSAFDLNKIDLPDIVRRKDLDNEKIRDKDYTVDEALVNQMIEKLATLLGTDQIKNLFDLGETLRGAIQGIYTDDFLNTLVQYIYPLVTTEFAKVWAGLPSTYPLTDPVTTTLTLKIDNMDVALKNLGLNLLPQLLANSVRSAGFTDAATQLGKVTSVTKYVKTSDTEGSITVDSWKDSNIYDADTEKLTLVWGITDRESFVNAAVAALSGVEPLLKALLSSSTYSKTNVKVGTGSGSYACVDIKVDPINLNMTFSGNPGYNNVIVPILQALGLDNADIPDGNTLTSTRLLIENGLVTPIGKFIDKLAADPINTLLDALPTLAYALDFKLVAPLLNELKTEIAYQAIAKYDAGIGGSGEKEALSDNIDINLGEMIDLEDMGIDLSKPSALINSIIGLLNKDEEPEGTEPVEPTEPGEGEGEGEGEGGLDISKILPILEKIDIDKLFFDLAYLAKGYTWLDSYRTNSPFATYDPENHPEYKTKSLHIIPNKADELIYILQFVIDFLLDNPDVLTEEGQALPEILQTVLDNLGKVGGRDNAIAAVAELMLPVRYDTFDTIEWATSTYNPTNTYLQYDNEWTKEVANIIINDADTTIAEVVANLGVEGFTANTSLNDFLKNTINGLFTNETITTINNAIANLPLDASLLDLLKNLLGIDLSGFVAVPKGTDKDWGVTDKDSFVDALCNLLAPLGDVLNILIPGKDFAPLDGTITIYGYDVYPQSLGLLFEALGIEPLKSADYAELSSTAALAKVLKQLTARVDTLLTGNVVKNVLDLVPNLVLFLESNGLSVALKNLLHPVLILLDVIRPIYDLDLYGEIEGKLADKFPIKLDDLKLSTIVDVVDDTFGSDLSRSPLLGYGIPAIINKTSYGEEGYTTTLGAADVLTILLSAAVEALDFEIPEDHANAGKTNAEVLLGGIDDDTVKQIPGVLHKLLNMKKAQYKEIDWLNKDKANTDAVFTPMDSTKEFSKNYGPLFTKEKAQYIADNLDAFLDNLVQLLGIPASTFDGLNLDIKSDSGFITSVEDLVNGLLEGTLYKRETAEKILDAVKGIVDKIDGVPASALIKKVLKEALSDKKNSFDLDYYKDYEIPAFTDGDKAGFVNAVCDILKPLYPLLQWLLSDRDISILYKEPAPDGSKNLITLFGFNGYRYGIAPIFEALDVKNIPTQEAINAKTTTEDLLKAIINPLLDRLDEIIADPVNEIFAILPEVAYFINTKGLDVSYKNLLSALTTVMDAVKPLLPDDAKTQIENVIAGQFGDINITELTMQTLLDMIAGSLGDGMDSLVIDAVAETTFGKLVKYDSELKYDAYKMQYADDESKADTVTALLRLLLRWIATGDNPAKLKQLVRDNIEMSNEGYAYIDKLIDIVGTYAGTNSGMDSILHMLYYIFYGVHSGTTKVADWQRDYNTRLQLVAEGQKKASSRDENLGKVAELLDFLFTEYVDSNADTGNVYHNYPDSEYGNKPGFAANGFIAFFQQLIQWIKTIINKIFNR